MDNSFAEGQRSLNANNTSKAQWEEPRVELEYSLLAQAQQPNDGDPLVFVGPLGAS